MTPHVAYNSLDSYSWAGQAVTWIIVVMGWVVVSKQIKAREARREAWELITDFKKVIREIETSAANYWTTDPSHPDCNKMVFEIKTCSKRIAAFQNIFKIRKKELKIDNSVTLFRQSVSGGDFEVSTRKKLEHDSIGLYEISSNANKLILAIEKSFFNKYDA